MSLDTLKRNELEGEKLLVEAASNGDLEKVISLLNSGISVDAEEHNRSLFYASKNYLTPLQLACANGHSSCAEVLITHNADVNAKDRFDVTALHMAAEKGHLACLKELLIANAECSLPTKYSKTGCYTAVPYLGGTTPLHLAAANKHVECIQELIQYGADYNAVDELGRTSLYIAAQFGFGECVLVHLRNAVGRDILSLPSYETKDTPLHFAVSRGMVDSVQALLQSGSDVNHLNYGGVSPLHLAVLTNNECDADSMAILKMLVFDGYNTNINLPDSANFTALHYVCFNSRNTSRRRPEMAKFLISLGANVNIKGPRNCSLLEFELKSPAEDSEVLKYVVRSMLQPPHLASLRVTPQLPLPAREHHQPAREHHQPAREHHPPAREHHPPAREHHRLLTREQLGFGLPSMEQNLQQFREQHVVASRELFELPPNVQEQLQESRIDTMVDYQLASGVLHARAGALLQPPPAPRNPDHKHYWYEAIASNPRTLQHCCRYAIRKALMPKNTKYINTLPVPESMQRYLLLETGD